MLTMVVHRQESDGCSCMDLTTPLGHETFRSSIDVQELDSESGFVSNCVSVSSKVSLSFLSFFAVAIDPAAGRPFPVL